MDLIILPEIPEIYKNKKSTSYETTYLYTGFGRINTAKNRAEVIQHVNGEYTFFTRPHVSHVLSRVYHSEHVTVHEYEPFTWSETIGTDVFFFQATAH